MRVLRFTFGAGLIVVSALLLLGAAARALGMAVGELADTPQSLGLLGGFLLLAVLCAWGGYRVLRSQAAREAAERT
jgi:hypothetical protein